MSRSIPGRPGRLRSWTANIRGDTLSGIVVALALIPEAIGFSVIAGVDPKVGLYASVVIACTIAFAGGRPAMISAATAATAVVMVDLVRDHGVQYLFAATILMGLIQILAGLLRLGRLMRFVSQSVMTGFVNALAILIFLAQLPELSGVTPATYGLIALGLAIIYGFPRITRAVPSPLVAIAVLTAITAVAPPRRAHGRGSRRPALGAAAASPCRTCPPTWETLRILLPYRGDPRGGRPAGEPAHRADRRRHDRYRQRQEPRMHGPGRRQHGVGGVRRHGRLRDDRPVGDQRLLRRPAGRLSTLVAGAFLLLLLVALQDLLAVVPVAALTAVMIMVSINTFSWRSLARLRTNPLPSSAVMLATVLVVVATKDLAIGVLVGVLLSGVFFAGKVVAAEPGDVRPLRRRADPDLPGQRAGVLRLRRHLLGGDRRARAGRAPRDRRPRGAFLGHLGGRRPRPRGPQGAGPRAAASRSWA